MHASRAPLAPTLALLFLAITTAHPLSKAHATTIHVPGDQPSIQAGVDAAQPGDSVLVAPGEYSGIDNTEIDFGGKEISLVSEAGAEATAINGQGSRRGFTGCRHQIEVHRPGNFSSRALRQGGNRARIHTCRILFYNRCCEPAMIQSFVHPRRWLCGIISFGDTQHGQLLVRRGRKAGRQ